MSGVEVAGLALGALPLIISAIESYNEGLDPIKSFVRWERELPHFIRKLRNEHVHYAQTIRLLLEPITSEFELAEMLSDTRGQLWKDKEMAMKLQDKLQESFQAYQHTIADVDRIMKKIASKLDLDRSAELSRNDLEAIIAANPKKQEKFEFRKRIRFGMSKKTIKGLLEELSDCNKELERFTDKSEKLDTFRKATKPAFATRLQHIQGLAKNLHSTITSSWSCSCRSHHSTSLQLEQRSNLYASKKIKVLSKTSFTVSFSTFGDGDHPWVLQEAEVHIEEGEEEAYAKPALPSPKPKMTKTVSFGDKPPPPYSATPDPATSLQVTPLMQEVKDLCASIQTLHKSAPCIGFSLDSKTNLLKGVYPVDAPVEKPKVSSSQVMTLNELLNQPPLANGRPTKLSKKERYSLAVTLASSALQLNATPWFPDQWSAKDILFHQISAGTRLVDINHPYVSAKAMELKNGVKGPPVKTRTFQNKNTILLALAIALLELYFGESAEKHQDAENTPGPLNNPWTLCAIAYEWAEEEQENLSAAFSNAVNHCLRCFNDPSASLQDSDFLQAAVESIVLPLQDELYQFLGKTVA